MTLKKIPPSREFEIYKEYFIPLVKKHLNLYGRFGGEEAFAGYISRKEKKNIKDAIYRLLKERGIKKRSTKEGIHEIAKQAVSYTLRGERASDFDFFINFVEFAYENMGNFRCLHGQKYGYGQKRGFMPFALKAFPLLDEDGVIALFEKIRHIVNGTHIRNYVNHTNGIKELSNKSIQKKLEEVKKWYEDALAYGDIMAQIMAILLALKKWKNEKLAFSGTENSPSFYEYCMENVPNVRSASQVQRILRIIFSIRGQFKPPSGYEKYAEQLKHKYMVAQISINALWKYYKGETGGDPLSQILALIDLLEEMLKPPITIRPRDSPRSILKIAVEEIPGIKSVNTAELYCNFIFSIIGKTRVYGKQGWMEKYRKFIEPEKKRIQKIWDRYFTQRPKGKVFDRVLKVLEYIGKHPFQKGMQMTGEGGYARQVMSAVEGLETEKRAREDIAVLRSIIEEVPVPAGYENICPHLEQYRSQIKDAFAGWEKMPKRRGFYN